VDDSSNWQSKRFVREIEVKNQNRPISVSRWTQASHDLLFANDNIVSSQSNQQGDGMAEFRGDNDGLYAKEGFPGLRLAFVLGSFAPLFLLWAARGLPFVSYIAGWSIAGFVVAIPHGLLAMRLSRAMKNNDVSHLKVLVCKDQSETALAYILSMILPLVGTAMDQWKEFLSTMGMFLLVFFVAWRLNNYYINIVFAIAGYRVYTIYPPNEDDGITGRIPLVLMTRRRHLTVGQNIDAYRISNTVFLEKG
jgi:hypothetical protein